MTAAQPEGEGLPAIARQRGSLGRLRPTVHSVGRWGSLYAQGVWWPDCVRMVGRTVPLTTA
jgi:hypothetical protein